MSDSEHSIPLSDVTLERARQENNTIDEQFRDLETQLSTVEEKKEALADEKASLEADLESVREEKEALETVVATYKDERKNEILADIRSTIESAAVDADDLDVDYSELEEADLSTLKTTKQMVETTIEAAGLDRTERVSNRGSGPDLSDVEGDSDEGWEQAAQQAAADLGIESAWQKVEAGEKLADGPQAIGTDDAGHNDAVQELAELVSEVSNR